MADNPHRHPRRRRRPSSSAAGSGPPASLTRAGAAHLRPTEVNNDALEQLYDAGARLSATAGRGANDRGVEAAPLPAGHRHHRARRQSTTHHDADADPFAAAQRALNRPAAPEGGASGLFHRRPLARLDPTHPFAPRPPPHGHEHHRPPLPLFTTREALDAEHRRVQGTLAGRFSRTNTNINAGGERRASPELEGYGSPVASDDEASDEEWRRVQEEARAERARNREGRERRERSLAHGAAGGGGI
ncbi:hypothetical protein JCM8097_001464 [Rhodosporidiobolus ruineniae]